MEIEVRHLTKTFGDFVALDDVSLAVGSGELVALLGPSGSGKTTLLRIIAGLETPDAGVVLFDGQDAAAWSASARRVGFVFQHYALFRHMTVFENVAFGLRVRPRGRRPPEAEIRRRVSDLLALVQLEALGNRYPSQLSGGQRQRVALARALAVEPKVLLLDEPFGALDAKVRQELRRWLRRLHAQIHLTSIFVTHDQEEALELADRVVVMNAGRIEQEGSPEAVVDHPATPFVMTFVGRVNIFHGRVHGGTLALGQAEPHDPGLARANEPPAAAVYARPHELECSRLDTGDGLWATVRAVRVWGAAVRVELDDEAGHPIEVELARDRYEALGVTVGDRLYIRPRRVRVFTG
ncbi:MAG TPA: sulfate/molybdate ABC transporter ATP-binding protein [Vicinamibacterales bacterium]|nr:sulfate/molybdate ABC transporter ATP-binding protein [Vicinamibacterales bacterium]